MDERYFNHKHSGRFGLMYAAQQQHDVLPGDVLANGTLAASPVCSARLLPCAHRLLKGHRVRLQISGGAHPQYARNLGTGEPLSIGTGLEAAVHTIHHDRTRLTFPVTTTAIAAPS
jgi:hypothetical protein